MLRLTLRPALTAACLLVSGFQNAPVAPSLRQTEIAALADEALSGEGLAPYGIVTPDCASAARSAVLIRVRRHRAPKDVECRHAIQTNGIRVPSFFAGLLVPFGPLKHGPPTADEHRLPAALA